MLRKIAFAALVAALAVPLCWSTGDSGQSTALQEVNPEVAAQLYGGKIPLGCDGNKAFENSSCTTVYKGCVKATCDDLLSSKGSWVASGDPIYCGLEDCGSVTKTKRCDVTPVTGDVKGPG